MTPEISRRALLGGLATTGALVMTQGSVALAASRKAFFERTGLPIGLQIYTLGEEAGRDLDATFTQVAAIGYREIELPSLYGRPASEIRAAADRAGLVIGSVHLPAQGTTGFALGAEIGQVAQSIAVLGAKRAVVPIATFPPMTRQPGESPQASIGRAFSSAGADHWKRLAALLNERGAALKLLGIALGYHNHNVEFAPIGTTTGWDILVRETEAALVHFEIDVGWIATAGLDPASFLRRHRGRVQELHVKDVAAGNTPNFALSMKPAEVGSGVLDWAKILPAAYVAGVRHFYVEQEPPFTMPRIEAARKSYDFLKTLHA